MASESRSDVEKGSPSYSHDGPEGGAQLNRKFIDFALQAFFEWQNYS